MPRPFLIVHFVTDPPGPSRPASPCALGILALALLLGACQPSSGSTEPALVPGVALVPRTADPMTAGSTLLGANPPPITDYSRTHVYVDLVKQARRFGTPSSPWDEKALLGTDGWPEGDFGILLMTRQSGVQGLGGTYTVLFDGQAKVSPVATPARVTANRYDASRNASTVLIELPEGADQLALGFTQTGAGIKNLRVIRPGYDPKQPPLFTAPFLQHVQRFKTLRFMDWLRTNNNPVTRWGTRTDPDRVRYASRQGVPWEHVIALAQQTGQDIWINLPVEADDDYVTQLAQRLKAELPASTRVYVEYSNEVWNGQFRQHGTNWALARAEVEQNPQSPLAYGGSQDSNQWGYRRIAKRGKEISDLFRRVYGDAAMMSTIRPVFASQVVNPYATQLGLDFIAANYGPPANYFYALAGAPYFNLGADQRREGLSTDQVLQAMEQSVADLPRINQFERNQALASWYSLPWLAYEGGADSFGDGSLQAKMAANLDPRMENLCRRYLDTWYRWGGGLFMWFNAGAGDWSTPFGAWELTTDLLITDTPKIRCVDGALNASSAAPQSRNKAPGSFSALAYAGNPEPYSDASRTTVRHLGRGQSLDYLVLAPEAGVYRLTLKAGVIGDGNALRVAVNAQGAGSLELKASDANTPMDQPRLNLPLRAGFNTLRLTVSSRTGGFELQLLTLSF